MSIATIHLGTLRMYGLARLSGYIYCNLGGFIFKQWKKRFLLLTADGSLLVCHDESSPPDQLVALHSCETIAKGSTILDLPRLPTGGQRDCCFALLLPEDKYLLLLADTPQDCSQWVNILKKAKESVSVPPHPCQRHRVTTPCTPLNPGNEVSDMAPKQTTDKLLPVFDEEEEASSQSPTQSRVGSQRSRGKRSPRSSHNRVSSEGCLRHGTANNAETMRAVYLLMGGAAAASAMGYLGACSAANIEARAPDLPTDANFCASDGAHHSESHAVTSPHFHDYNFQMADMDYDVFDCGGFSF